MESVRLSISEHLTSVGEEILMALETQTQSGVCVRMFVLERLSSAAEFMFKLFQREMEALETLLETPNDPLETLLETPGGSS